VGNRIAGKMQIKCYGDERFQRLLGGNNVFGGSGSAFNQGNAPFNNGIGLFICVANFKGQETRLNGVLMAGGTSGGGQGRWKKQHNHFPI